MRENTDYRRAAEQFDEWLRRSRQNASDEFGRRREQRWRATEQTHERDSWDSWRTR